MRGLRARVVPSLLVLTLALGTAPAAAQRDAVPPAPTLEERLATVRARVQAHAAYPAIAREKGESGRSVVAFEIERDGTPSGVETLHSSGSLALDRAARRAVAAAAPLPWIHGRVEVPVDFVLRPGVSAAPPGAAPAAP